MTRAEQRPQAEPQAPAGQDTPADPQALAERQTRAEPQALGEPQAQAEPQVPSGQDAPADPQALPKAEARAEPQPQPQALAELEALADPARAAEMAAYHKAPRRYLGVAVPEIQTLTARWRAGLDVSGRVALAAGLWDSDVHEARIAAAKLLTQARIPEAEPLVWAETLRWVPAFDSWAIADHACKAIERRLAADPSRLDTAETWAGDASMWVRRAALVATLPWTRANHPDAREQAERDRILGWAATLTGDRDWFIQKAIGWWLRSLAPHDPDRVRAFLAGPGKALKPFARREAARRLPS